MHHLNPLDVTAVTARGAGGRYKATGISNSKPKGLVSMLFSGSPKLQMVLAIVGPSVSCGIFFMLAINYFAAGNHLSVVLMLLMLSMTAYITVQGCMKVLRTLP
jgi:hypothetical protein